MACEATQQRRHRHEPLHLQRPWNHGLHRQLERHNANGRSQYFRTSCLARLERSIPLKECELEKPDTYTHVLVSQMPLLHMHFTSS